MAEPMTCQNCFYREYDPGYPPCEDCLADKWKIGKLSKWVGAEWEKPKTRILQVEVKCPEAEELVNDALDEFKYKGGTLRQWADSIVNPITNADRIRAMSDEELADWLGVYCNGQTAQEVGKPCVSDIGSCEECWLNWLKEEAEGGEI